MTIGCLYVAGSYIMSMMPDYVLLIFHIFLHNSIDPVHDMTRLQDFTGFVIYQTLLWHFMQHYVIHKLSQVKSNLCRSHLKKEADQRALQKNEH